MARQTGAAITFDDAIYMRDNMGFIAKKSIPSGNQCLTRSMVEEYLHTKITPLGGYDANQLVQYQDVQAREYAWRGRESDAYCEDDGADDGYVLIMKTNHSASNWCFHRFRLASSSGAMVQARRPDGTVLDTQPFHAGGGWTANSYEHDFMFDFSYNTGGEEIEIYIKDVPDPANWFYQIYAVYAHAGSAVRYQDDPAASGMSNAQVTYINMEFLKFNGGSNDVRFVYLENNGLHTIDGPDQIYARSIDVSGNTSLSSATIDNLIIGVDNNGIYPANANGQSCYLTIPSGKRTSTSSTAWNNLVNKGWTLQEK